MVYLLNFLFIAECETKISIELLLTVAKGGHSLTNGSPCEVIRVSNTRQHEEYI